ncbi:MAG: putative metal-dependent hydrolase [Bacteroidetes bacterium]|nr:putative metal-dependent hydrolase [Bacteroidota bacterium]
MPDNLRYPIGHPQLQIEISDAKLEELIGQIQSAPALLRQAVADLSEDQLDTPYRRDGWTVRQVVHHVADSHLNAYIRFRWALTEKSPVIKAYNQDGWARLPDACDGPIEESLLLLDALHSRWCRLLKTMSRSDWTSKVIHPEDGERTCQDFLIIYAWHGLHHITHITNLRNREEWI